MRLVEDAGSVEQIKKKDLGGMGLQLEDDHACLMGIKRRDEDNPVTQFSSALLFFGNNGRPICDFRAEILYLIQLSSR